MDEMEDWQLLGLTIQREHVYTAQTTRLFAKKAQISSASLYKIFAGWEKTRPQALARIETALEWPRGSVQAILRHDHNWLRENFPRDAYTHLLEIITQRDKRETERNTQAADTIAEFDAQQSPRPDTTEG